MIKFSPFLTRLISTLTAFFFLFTTISPLMAAVLPPDQGLSLRQASETYLIPSSLGRVSGETAFSGSGRLVVVIQDLHCHPEVQRNINSILESLSSRYPISRIFLEGASGTVDLSWYDTITEPLLKNAFIESLMAQGKLSGATYFGLKHPDYAHKLFGLENKELHAQNLVRLSRIMDSQADTARILARARQSLDQVKKEYLGKRHQRLDTIAREYRSGRMTSDKYYTLLANLARKADIDIEGYRNIASYRQLREIEQRINYRQAGRELQRLLSLLREQLPYAEYRELAEKAGHKDSQDELLDAVAATHALPASSKPTLRSPTFSHLPAFSHLERLIQCRQLNRQLDPLAMVVEEKRLVRDIRNRLSESQPEREVGFLSDYFRCLEDCLNAKLTAEDYTWLNAQYKRFVYMWIKYAGNETYAELVPQLKQLRAFYDTNIERNRTFLNAIIADGVYAPQQAAAPQIDVVVMGGFHTEGMARLFKEQNIPCIMITPQITSPPAFSDKVYRSLIEEQGKLLSETIKYLELNQAPALEQARAVTAFMAPALLNSGYSHEKAAEYINNELKKAAASTSITTQKSGKTEVRFKLSDGKNEFIVRCSIEKNKWQSHDDKDSKDVLNPEEYVTFRKALRQINEIYFRMTGETVSQSEEQQEVTTFAYNAWKLAIRIALPGTMIKSSVDVSRLILYAFKMESMLLDPERYMDERAIIAKNIAAIQGVSKNMVVVEVSSNQDLIYDDAWALSAMEWDAVRGKYVVYVHEEFLKRANEKANNEEKNWLLLALSRHESYERFGLQGGINAFNHYLAVEFKSNLPEHFNSKNFHDFLFSLTDKDIEDISKQEGFDLSGQEKLFGFAYAVIIRAIGLRNKSSQPESQLLTERRIVTAEYPKKIIQIMREDGLFGVLEIEEGDGLLQEQWIMPPARRLSDGSLSLSVNRALVEAIGTTRYLHAAYPGRESFTGIQDKLLAMIPRLEYEKYRAMNDLDSDTYIPFMAYRGTLADTISPEEAFQLWVKDLDKLMSKVGEAGLTKYQRRVAGYIPLVRLGRIKTKSLQINILNEMKNRIITLESSVLENSQQIDESLYTERPRTNLLPTKFIKLLALKFEIDEETLISVLSKYDDPLRVLEKIRSLIGWSGYSGKRAETLRKKIAEHGIEAASERLQEIAEENEQKIRSFVKENNLTERLSHLMRIYGFDMDDTVIDSKGKIVYPLKGVFQKLHDLAPQYQKGGTQFAFLSGGGYDRILRQAAGRIPFCDPWIYSQGGGIGNMPLRLGGKQCYYHPLIRNAEEHVLLKETIGNWAKKEGLTEGKNDGQYSIFMGEATITLTIRKSYQERNILLVSLRGTLDTVFPNRYRAANSSEAIDIFVKDKADALLDMVKHIISDRDGVAFAEVSTEAVTEVLRNTMVFGDSGNDVPMLNLVAKYGGMAFFVGIDDTGLIDEVYRVPVSHARGTQGILALNAELAEKAAQGLLFDYAQQQTAHPALPSGTEKLANKVNHQEQKAVVDFIKNSGLLERLKKPFHHYVSNKDDSLLANTSAAVEIFRADNKQALEKMVDALVESRIREKCSNDSSLKEKLKINDARREGLKVRLKKEIFYSMICIGDSQDDHSMLNYAAENGGTSIFAGPYTEGLHPDVYILPVKGHKGVEAFLNEHAQLMMIEKIQAQSYPERPTETIVKDIRDLGFDGALERAQEEAIVRNKELINEAFLATPKGKSIAMRLTRLYSFIFSDKDSTLTFDSAAVIGPMIKILDELYRTTESGFYLITGATSERALNLFVRRLGFHSGFVCDGGGSIFRPGKYDCPYSFHPLSENNNEVEALKDEIEKAVKEAGIDISFVDFFKKPAQLTTKIANSTYEDRDRVVMKLRPLLEKQFGQKFRTSNTSVGIEVYVKDKADAVIEIISEHSKTSGIPVNKLLADSMVFGDSENDVTMLNLIADANGVSVFVGKPLPALLKKLSPNVFILPVQGPWASAAFFKLYLQQLAISAVSNRDIVRQGAAPCVPMATPSVFLRKLANATTVIGDNKGAFIGVYDKVTEQDVERLKKIPHAVAVCPGNAVESEFLCLAPIQFDSSQPVVPITIRVTRDGINGFPVCYIDVSSFGVDASRAFTLAAHYFVTRLDGGNDRQFAARLSEGFPRAVDVLEIRGQAADMIDMKYPPVSSNTVISVVGTDLNLRDKPYVLEVSPEEIDAYPHDPIKYYEPMIAYSRGGMKRPPANVIVKAGAHSVLYGQAQYLQWLRGSPNISIQLKHIIDPDDPRKANTKIMGEDNLKKHIAYIQGQGIRVFAEIPPSSDAVPFTRITAACDHWLKAGFAGIVLDLSQRRYISEEYPDDLHKVLVKYGDEVYKAVVLPENTDQYIKDKWRKSGFVVNERYGYDAAAKLPYSMDSNTCYELYAPGSILIDETVARRCLVELARAAETLSFPAALLWGGDIDEADIGMLSPGDRPFDITAECSDIFGSGPQSRRPMPHSSLIDEQRLKESMNAAAQSLGIREILTAA